MAEENPFTQVYDALWDLLEQYEGFADLVKVGNRIKFSGDGNRDPIKQEVMSADLPEVRIVCAGGTPHLQRTSGSSSCIKRFEVQIATGEQLLNEELFPVEWEILRAMANWEFVVKTLTWRDKQFVKLARPVSFEEGVAMADLARGIKGWTAIWAVEIEMWFTTSDLQNPEGFGLGRAGVGAFGK